MVDHGLADQHRLHYKAVYLGLDRLYVGLPPLENVEH